jgi:hypothetical protein
MRAVRRLKMLEKPRVALLSQRAGPPETGRGRAAAGPLGGGLSLYADAQPGECPLTAV